MKKLFLSTFIMLFAFFGLAQKNVTGSVIDNEGKALAGATIVVQGTSNGTTTDFDGKFSIKSTEGSVLEASYLGYKTQSITIGTNANYEFVLSPDNLLEEVIITGQGSGIQKRKLSTTVDVLNEEEIDKLPALQIDQLLQSTTPSAQIRLSSDDTSRPNSSAITVNGRTGLILDRAAGKVNIPAVSGTSLTSVDISAMQADDAGLALIYRTRQEIFIAEGIRFVDMGIKLVINENEILQNDNITDGDAGTVAVIPSFIDSVKDELDAITFDSANNVATTDQDVTALIVQNKTSDAVVPFN